MNLQSGHWTKVRAAQCVWHQGLYPFRAFRAPFKQNSLTWQWMSLEDAFNIFQHFNFQYLSPTSPSSTGSHQGRGQQRQQPSQLLRALCHLPQEPPEPFPRGRKERERNRDELAGAADEWLELGHDELQKRMEDRCRNGQVFFCFGKDFECRNGYRGGKLTFEVVSPVATLDNLFLLVLHDPNIQCAHSTEILCYISLSYFPKTVLPHPGETSSIIIFRLYAYCRFPQEYVFSTAKTAAEQTLPNPLWAAITCFCCFYF